jgi:Ca-activated chloride channel family protein
MTAGDRVIEGELDERGAARDTYQAAIAAGHRAALAEEDRAGVFTMTVGNLMPGDVVTIALTLSGPLPIDDGEVTWQFPLVVAPRYMPGAALPGEQAGLGIAHDTTATPDASRISPPVLLPGLPSPVRLGVRLSDRRRRAAAVGAARQPGRGRGPRRRRDLAPGPAPRVSASIATWCCAGAWVARP